jgi:hypothetical protein
MPDRSPAWTDSPDDPPELRQRPGAPRAGSEPLSNGSGRAAAAPIEVLSAKLPPHLAAMLGAVDLDSMLELARPMVATVRLNATHADKIVAFVEGLGLDPWSRRRLAFRLLEGTVVELAHWTPEQLDAWAKVPASIRDDVPHRDGWARLDREPPSPASSPASPRVS